MSGIPLSGPIIGMVLLLAGMLIFKGPSAELRASSSALLGYLSLLFVPAGVGIINYFRLIGHQWLTITVALIISSVLAMAGAGLVVQSVNQLLRSARTRVVAAPAS